MREHGALKKYGFVISAYNVEMEATGLDEFASRSIRLRKRRLQDKPQEHSNY